MTFFDFHCHPFTKPIWMEGDRQKLLEENITTVIDRDFEPGVSNLILRWLGRKQLEFFNSQSSLKQIREGNGQIIVASLVAMENAYANLGFCAFKNVFQRIKGVNRPQLRKLGKGEISYAFVTDLERAIASDFADQPLHNLRYRIVNAVDDIQDDGVINVILSVEGGHCFYGRASVSEQEKAENLGEVLQALDDWKDGTLAGTHPRLLYITLTHHTTNVLTNHAFAVPPGLAGNGTNTNAGGFNPDGDGISPTGESFIKNALSEAGAHKRILIDLKHMSVKARQEFYALRRQMIAEGHRAFPLIATHMGVTGLPYNDAIVAQCYKFSADPNCYEVEYGETERLFGFRVTSDANGPHTLRFYPWSINLYDEEIREIVASDGMIGFSFDSRILGNEPTDRERFCKRETGALPSIAQINFGAEFPIPHDPENRIGYRFRNHQATFGPSRYPEASIIHLPPGSDKAVKKHTDLMALCQNIIHTVRVGGPDTWNRICIGSDFDGLINTIDFAPNASAIPGLEPLLVQYLGLMVGKLNQFIDQQGNNEPKLTFPPDVFDRFTITNAQRFLAQNFR